MTTVVSTPLGRQAILDALRAHDAGPNEGRPWVAAADLARSVGARGPTDPQFLADAQALAAAGAVRLMGDSRSADTRFYEAMLVRLGATPVYAKPRW